METNLVFVSWVFQELRHSFNITTLSPSSMPAQEECPEFTQHAFPLAQDLTNLSRVLLQALAYAFGKNLSQQLGQITK